MGFRTRSGAVMIVAGIESPELGAPSGRFPVFPFIPLGHWGGGATS